MYVENSEWCKPCMILDCFEEIVTTCTLPAGSLKSTPLMDTCSSAHQNTDDSCPAHSITVQGTACHSRYCRSNRDRCKDYDMPNRCKEQRAEKCRSKPRQHNSKITAHKSTQTLTTEELTSPIVASLIQWLAVTCQNFLSRFSDVPGVKNESYIYKSFQDLHACDSFFWHDLIKRIHNVIMSVSKPHAESRNYHRRPRKHTVPDSDIIIMSANMADNVRAINVFDSTEGMKGEGEHVTIKYCDPKSALVPGQCLLKRTLSRVNLLPLHEVHTDVGSLTSEDRTVGRKARSCTNF